MRRATSCMLIILAMGALLVACGCKKVRLLSQEDEVRMGREAGDEFERKHGLDADPGNRQLVSSIGARIAKVAVPPDYPYEFRVLRGDEVNAVAFPGGRIYVWKGLIGTFEGNEDKLAWVLGHEAAHVSRRHATRRIEKALGFEAIITLILRKEGARQVAGLAADLVLRDYGRDQEYEADRWGLTYARNAGYDPTAAVAVLTKFQELQKHEPSDLELLFATHPGNNDRINAVKAYIRERGWSGRYWAP